MTVYHRGRKYGISVTSDAHRTEALTGQVLYQATVRLAESEDRDMGSPLVYESDWLGTPEEARAEAYHYISLQ